MLKVAQGKHRLAEGREIGPRWAVHGSNPKQAVAYSLRSAAAKAGICWACVETLVLRIFFAFSSRAFPS